MFLLPHTLPSIYYLLIFFYDGHSDWYEVIPHYKFDLHFSNEWSEKAMAPHSSTLAWKIPWTEQPGRLQSMGSLRVGHDWAISLSLFTFMHWRRKWQPTPVFLPGESQGRGSLVGCRLWGRTVGHDWNDLAAAAAMSGYWASFHVPLDHLYVFFREMSIQVFCPIFDWVVVGCFILSCMNCLMQHYLLEPGHGSNLNVQEQRNG